jgi:hypothetical protein
LPGLFVPHCEFVADPDKFKHRVSEGETAARGALSEMLVRRSLRKPEAQEFVSFGRARRSTHENVIQFDGHAH